MSFSVNFEQAFPAVQDQYIDKELDEMLRKQRQQKKLRQEEELYENYPKNLL